MADDEKKQDYPLIGVDPGAQIKYDFEQIDDKKLIELIKSKASELLIVDVRDPDEEDGDYVGGNVKGSVNIPTFDFVEKLPEIITDKNLQAKNTVVFYCMSGKGSSVDAYKLYNKARSTLTASADKKDDKTDDEFAKIVATIKLDDKQRELLKSQKTYVLQGGFHMFLNYHKDDKTVIENFNEKYWELTKLDGKDNEGLAYYHTNNDE
eukprot:CAMPEP_0202686576 /NCGR_PEP_ID=MMETSP1385-20130828/2327_1 /ASSEMBLY_ACC=CAM_ASM_000861 /TAXON_ID=933848 /ORGANISM="Elphidium margaritaceum" /LENGTH=207 /DNA_ID=CAMNT_0049341177 /DNA_START=109 /DNA_END=732 /DNA_ORIENTATION=+